MFLATLASLLRFRGFRRLLAVRLVSQGADGMFQAALASHVLFNPEHAADAGSIATAFAVVLLPYSVIGPLAGGLLDFWPRRRVILVGQLVRAAVIIVVALVAVGGGTSLGFLGGVLVVLSLNRFVLAGLSASLPHTVDRAELLGANTVAPASGSVTFAIGLAAGGLLRSSVPAGSDRTVMLVAAAVVVCAAALALRLPHLGPDDDEPGPGLRDVLHSSASGLGEARRDLPARGWFVIALVFLGRLPFGLLLVTAVLLFRGPFADSSPGAVLAGAAWAVGFVLGVLLAPRAADRLGTLPGLRIWLATGGVLMLVLAPWQRPWTVVALSCAVAFVSQIVKITCDTLVQRWVPDHLIGRAFAFYDVAFNAGVVTAAAIAAASLPDSGRSWYALGGAGLLYLCLAVLALPAWRWASEHDTRRWLPHEPADPTDGVDGIDGTEGTHHGTDANGTPGPHPPTVPA